MTVANVAVLTILRRLRRAETDVSRRELGDATAHEATALAHQMTLTRQINEAREFADDFDREAFAAWFGRALAELSRLANATHDAAARTAAARADLAARRMAETAAENALTAAMAERAAEMDKREQLESEDAARASKRRPR